MSYTSTPRRGETQHYDYRISLATTRPHFGGLRWWFRCPLITQGQACGRRVNKLYLPGGRLYFGCRQCYELTYESCQESHKYDRLWRSIGMDAEAIRLQERRLKRLSKFR